MALRATKGDEKPAASEHKAGFSGERSWPRYTGLKLGTGQSISLEFAGTPRFRLLRRIGAGGMGVVYEAFDEEQQARVALKTLPYCEPAALYRFKQEFRSLAGIVHPNLVSLYELFAEQDVWFFSMEFVEGGDLLTSLRRQRSGASESSSTPSDRGGLIEGPETATLAGDEIVGDGAAAPVRDYGALRHTLAQLAEGLGALHAGGKLHRDIKPSNVLVTPQGRVVILDFGLVAELGRPAPRSVTMRELSGTVPYMAPEQAAQGTLAPAADWYAVGVMLYEALTGRLPFGGPVLRVLEDKQRLDPPPPSELAPDIPEDLERLCRELLARDPARRPSGREVLERLAGARPARRARLADAGVFVGRARQRALLDAAFAATRSGRPALALVRGSSGSGKSALVERFLQDGCAPDAVVLAGRCYEQETVPYKALDSIVDTLGRLLRRMPRADAASLLPRDVQVLARLFPVLRRAEVVAGMPARNSDVLEQHELRRRAFQALKELLNRIADRKALVLAIDDLQWGDADSAAALSSLLGPPDPPPALLIAAYRSEDAGRSACLRALLKPAFLSTVQQFDIEVDALEPGESLALAQALLAPGGARAVCGAPAIAAESGGHPYFIRELAEAVLAQPDADTLCGCDFTLEQIIWERVRALPEEARRLLEVVAVSGQPLAQIDAYQAAGILERRPAVLALLRSAHLVRSSGPRELDQIETYHDRIRETVAGRLTADERRGLHAALAATLEGFGRGDAETLAAHFDFAGDDRRAGGYYAAAAAEAMAAVAFDRAADLYRRALERIYLLPSGEPDRRVLELGLADALAGAGRGFDAARIYERVAAASSGSPALELKRKAAHQYGIAGHIDCAGEVLGGLLAAAKIRTPRTRFGYAVSTAGMLALLALRGVRFRERSEAEADRELLGRVDVAFSVCEGLSLVNMYRALYFALRGLRMALQSGDPHRVGRGLMLVGPSLATTGRFGRARGWKMLEACRGIAARASTPYLRGSLLLGEGLIAFLEGCWREALSLLNQAEAVLSTECVTAVWDLATARVFSTYTLQYQGEYKKMASLTAALLNDAQERGDLYTAANVGLWSGSLLLLARDQPERVDGNVEAHLAQWSRAGYHHEHWIAALALGCAQLYRGEAEGAWRTLDAQFPLMRRALFLLSEGHRIPARYYRAQSALAMGNLRAAERDAARLEREELPWAHGLAAVVRAGVANLRSDRAAAAAALERAIGILDSLGMGLYVASARYRLGELTGNRELVAEAEQWMRRQEIRNPARMAAMNVNGF